ncbi:MAG TPA: OmpH family outer membrane protein [Allosphingosinicella sp.]
MPAAVQAQPVPPAQVIVVDSEQIARTCTACAAAATQLTAQGQAIQARVAQMRTQLETERTGIQTAVGALPAGTQPDAALQARITAYEQRQQAFSTEIQGRQQTYERNQRYVLQQIGERVRPAVNAVMTQRGANLAVDAGQIINTAAALDVTAAVLAIVNQNAAPLNVNAPAQAATPATTPATTPPRPRPTGR